MDLTIFFLNKIIYYKKTFIVKSQKRIINNLKINRVNKTQIESLIEELKTRIIWCDFLWKIISLTSFVLSLFSVYLTSISNYYNVQSEWESRMLPNLNMNSVLGSGVQAASYGMYKGIQKEISIFLNLHLYVIGLIILILLLTCGYIHKRRLQHCLAIFYAYKRFIE